MPALRAHVVATCLSPASKVPVLPVRELGQEAAEEDQVRSKNSRPLTKAEHDHVSRVKGLHCCVCGAQPPNEAHHIDQAEPYSVVPLCESCHRGPVNGWHGQRRMWHLYKMQEIDALIATVAELDKEWRNDMRRL
jgi:hypothetical protein